MYNAITGCETKPVKHMSSMIKRFKSLFSRCTNFQRSFYIEVHSKMYVNRSLLKRIHHWWGNKGTDQKIKAFCGFVFGDDGVPWHVTVPLIVLLATFDQRFVYRKLDCYILYNIYNKVYFFMLQFISLVFVIKPHFRFHNSHIVCLFLIKT